MNQNNKSASNATGQRTHRCGEVTENLIGNEIRLAGWAGRIRDLGLSLIHI